MQFLLQGSGTVSACLYEGIYEQLRKTVQVLKMRIVHRLKQYEKLYAQVLDQPCQINSGTLAIIFSCSERHVRTLINHFESRGWVKWKSSPGRGNKSLLQ